MPNTINHKWVNDSILHCLSLHDIYIYIYMLDMMLFFVIWFGYMYVVFVSVWSFCHHYKQRRKYFTSLFHTHSLTHTRTLFFVVLFGALILMRKVLSNAYISIDFIIYAHSWKVGKCIAVPGDWHEKHSHIYIYTKSSHSRRTIWSEELS